MNCCCEGGGLRLSPRADVHDGALDFFVVNKLGKLLIGLMLPTAYIGLHTIFPGVHIYRARSAQITVSGVLPLHTDGRALPDERDGDAVLLPAGAHASGCRR